MWLWKEIQTMSREIGLIHAAVGILKRGDKLLIGERPLGKSYAGYWEFPGGKIEPNETGRIALERELKEELGITVVTTHLWHELTFTYPDKTVYLELWQVEEFSGEPQGLEQQKLSWVTLDEMVKMNLLAGMWPIIEKLKA